MSNGAYGFQILDFLRSLSLGWLAFNAALPWTRNGPTVTLRVRKHHSVKSRSKFKMVASCDLGKEKGLPNNKKTAKEMIMKTKLKHR